jgi:hypothetical protein
MLSHRTGSWLATPPSRPPSVGGAGIWEMPVDGKRGILQHGRPPAELATLPVEIFSRAPLISVC